MISTSDFVHTVIAVQQAETGQRLDLRKPYELLPSLHSELWDVAIVLPKRASDVLQTEKQQIARVDLVFELPSGKATQEEHPVPYGVRTYPEFEAAEMLVHSALAESE